MKLTAETHGIRHIAWPEVLRMTLDELAVDRPLRALLDHHRTALETGHRMITGNEAGSSTTSASAKWLAATATVTLGGPPFIGMSFSS